MESALKKQFQYRLTHKIYYARVWGVMEQNEGEVNLPLCCDWPNRPKQKVCFEEGRDSLTRYQVVKREENHSGTPYPDHWTLSSAACAHAIARSSDCR